MIILIMTIVNLFMFNWRYFFKKRLYFNKYKGKCYFDSYWFGLGNKCINFNDLYIKKSVTEGYICGFKPNYSSTSPFLTECFFGGYHNLEKLIPIMLKKSEQKDFLKEFNNIEVRGILYRTFFSEEGFEFLKLEVL